jgi:Lipopolysaccharide-assembly
VLLSAFIVLGCGFLQQVPAKSTAAPKPQQTVGANSQADLAARLLTAKRIYVESFGNDSLNKTLQAMLIDAFTSSKRYIITENKERADLILKGSALEKTSQELHAIGSATAVASAAGHRSGSVGGFAADGSAIEDSQASTETISDARIAVRLVSPDGDVVWSTTQESKGAKYKSATADVAEKIVKQLLHDIQKLDQPKPAENGK